MYQGVEEDEAEGGDVDCNVWTFGAASAEARISIDRMTLYHANTRFEMVSGCFRSGTFISRLPLMVFCINFAAGPAKYTIIQKRKEKNLSR